MLSVRKPARHSKGTRRRFSYGIQIAQKEEGTLTISLRSIKMLMQSAAPEIPISDEAAKMLKVHLEEHGHSLAEQASRIQQRENELRKTIGERLKKRLSAKHMRMAIDGKFVESGENQR